MASFKKILFGLLIVGGVMALGIGSAWYFLSPSTPAQPAPTSSGALGTGDNRPITTNDSQVGTSQEIPAGTQTASKKIFKLAEGPVAGATFIQTSNPTTTLVRFVKADNGHIEDLSLAQGSVPSAVSNTTIPGVVRALWEEGGNAAVVQYLDGSSVKTAYIGFPLTAVASSSLSKAVRLQFLPDGITALATSPDGKNLAYTLRSAAGADTYIAKSDGTGPSKLFSLPLSQILLSWPTQTTLLAQTKSAAGSLGMLFSVTVQSGAVVPIVAAPGVTAQADKNFSHFVYQTVGGDRASYVRDIKNSTDMKLSFDPMPEKCVWSSADSVTLYCAVPLTYVASNYLDLWHAGTASAADSIVAYNILSGRSTILATPGESEGGFKADIAELGVSPDGRYLLYIQKGERSLWGVKLEQ